MTTVGKAHDKTGQGRPQPPSTRDKPRWIFPTDCRDFTETIPDDTISLIITDPPYFTDGMDNKWDNARLLGRVKRAGVIGSLPVGMKFDPMQGQNLQGFLTPIAEEWMRIIRPGGFVLCFSQNRLVHHTAMAIENAGFEIRDALAWRYEGQPKAFTQSHFIHKRNIPESEKSRLLRSVGDRKTPQLKPQCELIVLAQAPRDGTFVDNWDKWQTGLIDTADPVVEPNRFPGTVVSVPKPRNKHGHMTAKPVELLRHLIRIFSVKGAQVFDPFAGSGSTGVAARMEGRAFAGTEIDSDMASKADRRVDDLSV